jgi:hypothetical protein
MLNNSAVLNAYLYDSTDENLIPEANITGVTFTIVKPDGDPTAPDIDHVAGTVVAGEDGHGQYVVDPSLTDIEGEYKGFASFTFTEGTLTGLVRSVTVDFTVSDPLVRVGASASDGSIRQAWMKIEDCFDSEQGGPWLRDMTLAVFDQTKVRGLVPEVLLDVNNQMPYTDFTEASFPYTTQDGEALIAQGLLVSTIRHLMRSYTEQPDVTSSPVAFMDRKRYQDRWKAQYDVEKLVWDKWLNRWKLRAYDITHGSLLLGSKAGRMLPAPMRSRNVGRGF